MCLKIKDIGDDMYFLEGKETYADEQFCRNIFNMSITSGNQNKLCLTMSVCKEKGMFVLNDSYGKPFKCLT